MDKITKEEFLMRVEEDKFFDSPRELIEYRYPCLIFFKEEYLPRINTMFGPASAMFNNEEYDKTKFTAVNRAWEGLIKNKGGL